jgi:DNA-binding transcriptional MerR regulator
MNSHAAATHYTAGEVAAAIGISPEKQLQWDDRGVTIPSRNDVRPNGSGEKRLMSRETVYQLALTAALARLGIPAKQAAAAARKLTDQPSPGRPAGKLYPQDRTVLALRETGPVVINAPYHADFCDLSNHGTSLVAIDAGAICRNVDTALSKLKRIPNAD